VRARKSIQSEWARPKIRNESADPARLSKMSGRLPQMSEARPQMGAKMNCITEKTVESHPATTGVPPNLSI
jgi:hypothetical protein